MPGDRLGPYTVLSELGAGGMGTVYLAEARAGAEGVAAGSRVALKVVHPHLVTRARTVERFQREARIGLRVRHENVVSAYAVGTVRDGDHDALYLVMEHVVGRTLRSLLEDLQRVPEGLLREITQQLAAGLAAIHAQGVVHRDLKPENVLLTDSHEIRIMDLGVAHVIDASVGLTETGDFAGSLLYAAPEQFGADPVGPAADLYALGVLLHELATGRHPFRYEDAGAIIRAHLEEVPPQLADVVPDISPFFSDVVRELLAKELAHRLASADVLRDLMEQGEGSGWWRERRTHAMAVASARPRVPVPRDTALYGRQTELDELRRCWEEARDGRGCTILLEGEAGIGKTRLVDAFVDEVAGEDTHTLYGAYHPSGGFGGLSGAILDHFEGADLARALAPYLGRAPTLAPGFAAILQHATPPATAAPVSGDALQALTVYLMRGLAAEKPLLWILDDLQFAGPDSRRVALGLARAVAGHRVLLLMTARPGMSETELAHYERLPTVQRLALRRLSPREVIELLRDALHNDAAADRLGGTVAYKSDGVPLFVLEMVRGLKEGKLLEERADGSYVPTQLIEDLQVPSAVRGLVAARLSSLVPEERAILDVGAVQGYEFDAALVARVLDMKRIPVLQTLAEIERRSGIVRASGRRLRFDHHQIQEVLYDTLPEALRAEYHAALADAFAHAASERRDALADVPAEDAVFLASHHLRGSRPEAALPYLQRALDHLESSYRNEALVDLIASATAVPGLLALPVRAEFLLRQAERLGYLGRGDAEQEALAEAERLAQIQEARPLLASVKTRWGRCHVRVARYDEADLALAEACFLAREAGDAAVESAAMETRGVATFLRARYTEARRHFERARDLARRAGDRRAEAKALGGMGIVLRAQGRHEEARVCHEQHLAMASEVGDRRGVMNALGNLANLLNYQREYEASQTTYERALQVALEIGDRAGQAALQGSVGSLLWVQGRLADAHGKFESTLLLDREIGNRDGEARMLLNLAGLWRVLGAAEPAREHDDAALELCRQIDARLLEGHALLGLGAVQRELARYDEARACCEEAIALFRRIGQHGSTAVALEALAVVLEEGGHPLEARTHLQEALALTQGDSETVEVAGRLCRLAALPGGDVERALSAWDGCGQSGSVFQRMQMLHLLWRATRDLACLDEAWTLLSALRDAAPPAWRDAMLACVRLHRDIREDHERAHA